MNLWTKFKHWLIKKLGGYVNEPIQPIVHHYGEHEVVTLTICTKVDAYDWFGHDSEANRERYKTYAKRALASEIFDRADDFIKIDVDDTPKFDTDIVTVRATVRVVKNAAVTIYKKEYLTDKDVLSPSDVTLEELLFGKGEKNGNV